MQHDAGWHFRRKTQMTHVGHVVFGDQLIFGRLFVKRFALCYRTVVCTVCNLGVLWPNGRASSRIMYCGHSTQHSHLVLRFSWLFFGLLFIQQQSITHIWKNSCSWVTKMTDSHSGNPFYFCQHVYQTLVVSAYTWPKLLQCSGKLYLTGRCLNSGRGTVQYKKVSKITAMVYETRSFSNFLHFYWTKLLKPPICTRIHNAFHLQYNCQVYEWMHCFGLPVFARKTNYH